MSIEENINKLVKYYDKMCKSHKEELTKELGLDGDKTDSELVDRFSEICKSKLDKERINKIARLVKRYDRSKAALKLNVDLIKYNKKS